MARFVPNRNLDNQLKREVRYNAALLEAAQDAANAAKTIARHEAYDEGDYHDSIRAVIGGAEVRLEATDFKAWWIEKGSANNPVSAPLRRGSRTAGLRFTTGK